MRFSSPQWESDAVLQLACLVTSNHPDWFPIRNHTCHKIWWRKIRWWWWQLNNILRTAWMEMSSYILSAKTLFSLEQLSSKCRARNHKSGLILNIPSILPLCISLSLSREVMSAPNLLRVGTAENIFVEIQDCTLEQNVNVLISVLNHPTKTKVLASTSLILTKTNDFQQLGQITVM